MCEPCGQDKENKKLPETIKMKIIGKHGQPQEERLLEIEQKDFLSGVKRTNENVRGDTELQVESCT